LFLLLGCNDIQDITEDREKDYYLYLYTNDVIYNTSKDNSYTSVAYKTLPLQRVYWTSPDSFDVYHQGIKFRYSIINYSTYARQDGSGKQMIYLDKTMIDKTLTIIGCLDTDYCIESNFDVK